MQYIYYVVFITEIVRRRPSRSLGTRTSASEDNEQLEFTALKNKNAAWRHIVILPGSRRCLSFASSTKQEMHRQGTITAVWVVVKSSSQYVMVFR